MNSFYFSVQFLGKGIGVGFTDTLTRFRSLYCLGIEAGGEFVHSPLTSPRSSDEISGFLGLESDWPRSIKDAPYRDMARVAVKFDSMADFGFEQLKQAISTKAGDSSLDQGADKLVVLDMSTAYGVARTVSREFQFVNDRVDFLGRYRHARSASPLPGGFRQNCIKMLVHIRQGDTGVLETPWQTVIHRNLDQEYSEYPDVDALMGKIVEPETFYQVVSNLLLELDTEPCDTRVFSDGYERTFDLLERALKKALTDDGVRGTLNLDKDQLDSLLATRESYNEKKYSSFERIDGVQCVVGESDSKLFMLVDAILTADVLVIGPQQRMIPKLLDLYRGDHRPRLVVRLQHGWRDFSDLKSLEGIETLRVDVANLYPKIAAKRIAKAIRALKVSHESV